MYTALYTALYGLVHYGFRGPADTRPSSPRRRHALAEPALVGLQIRVKPAPGRTYSQRLVAHTEMLVEMPVGMIVGWAHGPVRTSAAHGVAARHAHEVRVMERPRAVHTGCGSRTGRAALPCHVCAPVCREPACLYTEPACLYTEPVCL